MSGSENTKGLFLDAKTRLAHLLESDPNFTGQVDFQIHLKEGKIKDVYVMSRSKMMLGTNTGS
jgi:hypothetical protein